jgi:hypothetical protein
MIHKLLSGGVAAGLPTAHVLEAAPDGFQGLVCFEDVEGRQTCALVLHRLLWQTTRCR